MRLRTVFDVSLSLAAISATVRYSSFTYNAPARVRPPIAARPTPATTRTALPSAEKSGGQVEGGVARLLERLVAKVAAVASEPEAAVAALPHPGPDGDREEHVKLVVRQPAGDSGEVAEHAAAALPAVRAFADRALV
jgi:hypothetical protein